MRDYGRIPSRFWEVALRGGVSDQAKLLALYLLAGPHTNLLGCFRLPKAYVAGDLGWTSETVSERFTELVEIGFVMRDEASGWILIRDFLAGNRVENSNQAKAAAKLCLPVPQGYLRDELWKEITRYVGFDKGFEHLSKLFPNQEQEQEQEQSTGPSQGEGGKEYSAPRLNGDCRGGGWLQSGRAHS